MTRLAQAAQRMRARMSIPPEWATDARWVVTGHDWSRYPDSHIGCALRLPVAVGEYADYAGQVIRVPDLRGNPDQYAVRLGADHYDFTDRQGLHYWICRPLHQDGSRWVFPAITEEDE